MEEAAAQERVRQFLLIVRRDDHDRPVRRHHRLTRLVDEEPHAIEFEQQVVRELDVCLVHLIDQHDDGLVSLERVPQLAAHDVVGDVVHPRIAQLAVAQARHRVVLVKALLCLGGRLDVPLDQFQAESLRHFVCQHGLAGAGLALHQQRALQRHGGIHRHFQITRGDITFGTLEGGAHSRSPGQWCAIVAGSPGARKNARHRGRQEAPPLGTPLRASPLEPRRLARRLKRRGERYNRCRIVVAITGPVLAASFVSDQCRSDAHLPDGVVCHRPDGVRPAALAVQSRKAAILAQGHEGGPWLLVPGPAAVRLCHVRGAQLRGGPRAPRSDCGLRHAFPGRHAHSAASRHHPAPLGRGAVPGAIGCSTAIRSGVSIASIMPRGRSTG